MEKIESSMKASRRGFTVVELLITMFIASIVLISAMGGWLYIQYNFKRNSVQQELDIDVRIAMENFKRDVRLSSLREMVFYPAGPGPYSAVSFPLATDDNADGLLELDADGNMIWDETIIYHVYTGSPNQLRRTVISPRADLTDAQRYSELASVVSTGHGPIGSTSTPLFSNLFEWELQGKGGVIDAYSPVEGRKANEMLGSAIAGPGTHQIRFTAVAKNDLSSDFTFGLDNMVVSASGSVREGEAQIVNLVAGATTSTELKNNGQWTGNYHLAFGGGAAADFFELDFENDCWEITNFTEAGYQAEKVSMEWDPSIGTGDFVVRLQGDGYAWQASEQTSDPTGTFNVSDDALKDAAVRVLIKGAELGGFLHNDGGNPWLLFRAPTSGGAMKIKKAHIAESASTLTTATPNTVGPGVELKFGGSGGTDAISLAPGSSSWATPPAGSEFPIDADKTYAVSFLMDTVGQGNVPYYENPDPTAIESYIIPSVGHPSAGDLDDTDWSTFSPVASPRMFAISGCWPEHVNRGIYLSPVFDTHLDAPTYNSISWSEANESGTSIEMLVRTGSNPAMGDALAWTNLTARANGGGLAVPSKRFVQFRAKLNASISGWNTPKLRDVRIDWIGENRIVDVAASYTTGPNKGIYEVTVDGKPLIRGLTASIEIYEDVPVFGGTLNRLTSEMIQEIEPRNTVRSQDD